MRDWRSIQHTIAFVSKTMHAPALWRHPFVVVALFALTGSLQAQDESADDEQPAAAFEIHEWHVWIADPTLEQMNSKDHYPSTMPGVVDTLRARDYSPAGRKKPSPLSMMFFHGEAAKEIELEIRAQNGRFLAHWPTGDSKSNRLRWIDMALSPELADTTKLAYINPEHWFQRARELPSNFVELSARSERFIAYDAEFGQVSPVKLTGGPDKFEVTNTSAFPLHDLTIIVKTDAGRRVGRIDVVPAATGANVAPAPAAPMETPAETPAEGAVEGAADVIFGCQPALAVDAPAAPATAPVAAPAEGAAPTAPAEGAPTNPAAATVEMGPAVAQDSAEYRAATRDALRARLIASGLTEQETDMLLDRYEAHLFAAEETIVLFRWPAAAIDEKLPLVSYPDAAKTVRTALVMVRNADPQVAADIDRLVAQLGSFKYDEREAAGTRLIELGRLAIPSLRKALENTDAEIALRAERLLIEQNEQVPE